MEATKVRSVGNYEEFVEGEIARYMQFRENRAQAVDNLLTAFEEDGLSDYPVNTRDHREIAQVIKMKLCEELGNG